ncbi:MAG: glycosyltransferase family 4 protein [Candidatus Hydrothermia bacterium]
MKILIISPWCDDMDLETCKGTPENAYLLKGLLDKGHEIIYVCQGKSEKVPENLLRYKNLRVLCVKPFRLLKPPQINYIANFFRLKAYGRTLLETLEPLLRKENFDIIYNIGGYGHLEILNLSRTYKVPYAVKTMGTIHFEETRRKFYRKFQYLKEHLIFKYRARHYFLVDDGTKTVEIAKSYGIPDNMITILPNPKPSELRPAPRNAGSLTIGYFSRFDRLKGTDLFYKIAMKILSKMQNVKFLIAGDGPMLNKVKKLEEMFPLNVQYVGFLEHKNLIEYYYKIDILLSTNRYSNSTLPVIEALASGATVVAFNTQDTSKMVLHGVNGLLATPFNLNEISGHILTLLNDPSLLQKLWEGARNTASYIPTWEERINLEINKLEEIAGEVH